MGEKTMDMSFTSLSSDNSYLHWCAEMDQRRYYNVCARLVDQVRAKLSVQMCYAECELAIQRGKCPAIAMRKEELDAEQALYYVERPASEGVPSKGIPDVTTFHRRSDAGRWNSRSGQKGKKTKTETPVAQPPEGKKPAASQGKGPTSPMGSPDSQDDLADALAEEAKRLSEDSKPVEEVEEIAEEVKTAPVGQKAVRKKGESMLEYARRLKGNK